MKNKITQILYYVNTVDARYLRLAYFVLAFGVSIVMRSPSGGGSDPI
jgi:hypothetical protein